MPVSSGRIAKSRKGKPPTPHGKNHRWESFSTKLSKLHSLDPLRRVRRHDLHAEDLAPTTSYLQQSLERWTELNVSKPFLSFRREAAPLCDSLPQILHFEHRLMDLLAQHIALHEKEALAPMLDMLTAFAHDLGVRFEKHYARALGLLSDLLAKPQDVDVIEWAFGALAFLFKYLSKLLVPNLRPTYDALLAPLMGRTRHTPPHVARFAAEAASFLVRKAAAPSTRETALAAIVTHVRDSLYSAVGDRQFALYQDAVMTMFAEAMRGTGEAINSSGPALVKALLAAIPDSERRFGFGEAPVWTNVICGALTSLMHTSNAAALSDLMAAIVEHARSEAERMAPDKLPPWQLLPWFKIFGTQSGVRAGSKMAVWQPLVEVVVAMLGLLANARPPVSEEQAELLWRAVVVNLAVIWHEAPMEALIPRIVPFVQAMTSEPLMRWFVPFCAYFDQLDPTRFNSLFRKELQKFIVSHWSDGKNEDMLCVLLPRLSRPRDGEALKLPQVWQDQIVANFERLEISPFPERSVCDQDPQTWRDVCLPKYSALLQLLEATAVHPPTNARIADLLLGKLKLALRPSSALASEEEVHFLVGQGFTSYLRMAEEANLVDPSLGPLLRAAVPRFGRSGGFLHAFLEYEKSLARRSESERHERHERHESSESSASGDDPVLASLVQNLSSSSHALRFVSLQLLHQLANEPEVAPALEAMLQLEQLPVEIGNVRAFGMHIRKLGLGFAQVDPTCWLSRAIPSFLFGMLTIRLAPVWEHAIEALQQIGKCRGGDEAICDLAFQWLDVPSPRRSPPPSTPGDFERKQRSPFDCTNLTRLLGVASALDGIFGQPVAAMLKAFDEQQQQKTAELHAYNARTQALKVLGGAPDLAERRARRLVPHLLCWAGSEDVEDVEDVGDVGDVGDVEEDVDDVDDVDDVNDVEVVDDSSKPSSTAWTLADRKLLLGVLAKFTNSKAMFQQAKVYAALLDLLKSGDGGVQTLALAAIFTWKQESIRPYRESLEALLDDVKFKNEVVLLLQNDDSIKPEHRPELMPVLLRLLFGRCHGKKGPKGSGVASRLAVIRNLSVEEMGGFLDIAVGRLKGMRVFGPLAAQRKLLELEQPMIPARTQYGLLNMISSLVTELGGNTSLYMDVLLNSVLYCTIFACRRIAANRDASAGDDGDDGTADGDERPSTSALSQLRAVRTLGLKCLNLLFRHAPGIDWTPYRRGLMEEIVLPRIERLPTETAQGVSGLFNVFLTWSTLPNLALFFCADADEGIPCTLTSIVECLAVQKGKDEVKVFVLGIVQELVRLVADPATEPETGEIIRNELLDANSDAILQHLTAILRSPGLGSNLLDACIEAIIGLTPLLQQSGCNRRTASVLEIATFLLEQPPRRVSPRTKGRLLLVVEGFVVLLLARTDTGSSEDAKLLRESLYATLSALFGYFKDRGNREALARVFALLAASREDIIEVAALVEGLNSFAAGQIDEPDYNRRLRAFTAIAREGRVFTQHQWMPLLHNLLFFIRTDEEYGILASNSADGLRRFIQNVAACADVTERASFEGVLKATLLPALYAGCREQSATVRREYLRVFGSLLSQMPSWGPISDMRGLAEQGDDAGAETGAEASFFFNILSPAASQQLEALGLLEKVNNASEMSSQHISLFCIPLLEHFVFGQLEGGDGRGLGAQAALVIGSLARSLEWRHYRTILQRYISYIESRPESLKRVTRLLANTVDALVVALQERQQQRRTDPGATSRCLARTIPPDEKFQAEILNHLVPSLVKYVHEKNESEVSHRVPVGVVVAKMLMMLPEQQMKACLAGLLTDICHILRSKNFESREMTRDTLSKIAVILGPACFGFILKELRGALTKGYQLHVLSYTLHSMLVAVIPEFRQGDLDYCLPDVVTIIMDDVFGVTGQEKEADGYTNDAKEIRSSKSHDSMELAAKNSSIQALRELVQPLQAMLMQRVDIKLVRKIDALLTRITVGLLQNPASSSRDTLVFCYEVIQYFYQSRGGGGKGNQGKPARLDPRLRKYLYRRGASKLEMSTQTRYTHKLVRFAIEILRSVFKKHDHLRTSAHITGFVPILGDLVVAGDDEIKTAVFRLLAVIPKVPFPTADCTSLFKVAAKEAAKGVSQAVSVTTDTAQSALKLLSVILRDRKDVVVRDATVDLLLAKIRDDLTQPLYRHVAFNFLRAVLDRKVETATVYDTIDHAGTVMVTNDDKDTRDLARGAFFQFLREYPQKMARWAKQLGFIVANLRYEREGGRLSVMEVVHLLLMKSSDQFVQEVAATCFLPLVVVLANDDSEKCRVAAAELVRRIFAKADKERMKQFMALLRGWAANEENTAVMRLGVQGLACYFDGRESAKNDQESVAVALARAGGIIRAAAAAADDDDGVADSDVDLVNAALSMIRVLVDKIPAQLLSSSCEGIWLDVNACLVHPDTSVKLGAIGLVSLYLADFAQNNTSTTTTTALGTLRGSHGVELNSQKIRDFVRLSLGILNADNIDGDVATEAAQILIFLGPRLADGAINVEHDDEEEEAGEGEGEGDKATVQKRGNDLDDLFWRLSAILRKEIPPRNIAIKGKAAAIEVFETVSRRLPPERLLPLLRTLLAPLHHLTDPSIPAPYATDEAFKAQHARIRTRAQIMMDALQKRLGTAEYSRQLLAVREAVKQRRIGRSSKRKIEAVTRPERFGEGKKRKVERQKVRKQERGKEEKARRHAFKQW